jgi:protein phosphatase
MIATKDIQLINEIGKRQNNEDYAGFADGALFVLCDGVGGNTKGEVASRIVVETFLEVHREHTDFSLEQALRAAELAFTDYISAHPESQGMATTLVAAHIRDNAVEIGWAGDSRLYQFRDGKILFKTKDHSWVNDAVDAGILTLEEAIDHPKKNIITRAIRGSELPVELSTAVLEDIQPEDLFLLCSDGVLETWTDDDFQALFLSTDSTASFADRLKEECNTYSRDNFTAIVFNVELSGEIITVPDSEEASLDSGQRPQKKGLKDLSKFLLSGITKRFQKKSYDT